MGKMKANRKFVKGEEAVSAVIGVILMVAITVAIAATVYVYVSGMLPTGSKGAPAISMHQVSGVQTQGATNWVNFSIDSASSAAKWSDLEIQIGSTSFGVPKAVVVGIPTSPGACNYTGSGTPIKAGTTLQIRGTTTTVASGLEIKLIHTASNSVVYKTTIY